MLSLQRSKAQLEVESSELKLSLKRTTDEASEQEAGRRRGESEQQRLKTALAEAEGSLGQQGVKLQTLDEESDALATELTQTQV